MPKPINETIGRCACSTPTCDEVADVRKMRGNGRLYLVCNECGTIRPTGARFQDYILNNADMKGPDDPAPNPAPNPAPAPEPAPDVPEPRPAPKPAPRPARPRQEPEPGRGAGGFLSRVNDFSLDDF